MSASVTADPVRLQVEEALHKVVDGVTAIPCGIVRSAKRAVDRSVERVGTTIATPLGLVRSAVELTLNGVLGRVSATPGAAPSRSTATQAPRATGAVVEAPDAEVAFVLDGDPDDATTELPLHGYESLAASQVVARLSRLEPAELKLIRAFELAHRGRRTILGKIDQLLSGT